MLLIVYQKYCNEHHHKKKIGFLYFLTALLNTEKSLELSLYLIARKHTIGLGTRLYWSLTVYLKFPTVINLVRLFRTLVSVIGEYVAIEIVQRCRKL